MVFGNAKQHKQLGQVPVGRAKLPERAAKRVDAARRHIDRTEPAMRGKIGGSELLCPPAGQRLRLVPAGKEGQLLRIGFADRSQPAHRRFQRLFPADRFKLARPARANPFHRALQACR